MTKAWNSLCRLRRWWAVSTDGQFSVSTPSLLRQSQPDPAGTCQACGAELTDDQPPGPGRLHPSHRGRRTRWRAVAVS
jgi:hypothetical protein